MIRILLLVVIVARVSLEMQLVNYERHVTRKSRSYVEPTDSEYVYSKLINNPGTTAIYGNDDNVYTPQVLESNANLHTVNNFSDIYNNLPDITSDNAVGELDKTPSVDNTPVKLYGGSYPAYDSSFSKGKYNDKTINLSPPDNYIHEALLEYPSTHTEYSGPEISSGIREHSNSPYSVDYQIAKSEAKYNSKYMPSTIKADVEIEKLKSAMHYRPSSDLSYDLAYNTYNNFHVDEDDVRTSSRSPYDGWPYFYPYDYDLNKANVDNTLQKVVDKRYATDSNAKYRTIPVYEHQEYDKPYLESTTQDNPISGHQPFFSFVLNDYYEKSGDDDALNFKGVEWGNDFDYGHGTPVTEDITKNRQRLSRQDNPNNNKYSGQHSNNVEHTEKYDGYELDLGDSSTEKGYKKSHEFDNEQKEDKEKSEHQKDYQQNGQNHKQFKDFLDTFVNKFGGEKHNKNAKYSLQRNQDKGEKKKGFRRVYHKDEYQEDNEFYDNINNKAHVHEDSHSIGHSGGSEALVQSHAAAATGDETNSHSKKGNKHKSHSKVKHRGNDRSEGTDYDFNRYREEAKKAARINSAEYPDYSLYDS